MQKKYWNGCFSHRRLSEPNYGVIKLRKYYVRIIYGRYGPVLITFHLERLESRFRANNKHQIQVGVFLNKMISRKKLCKYIIIVDEPDIKHFCVCVDIVNSKREE